MERPVQTRETSAQRLWAREDSWDWGGAEGPWPRPTSLAAGCRRARGTDWRPWKEVKLIKIFGGAVAEWSSALLNENQRSQGSPTLKITYWNWTNLFKWNSYKTPNGTFSGTFKAWLRDFLISKSFDVSSFKPWLFLGRRPEQNTRRMKFPEIKKNHDQIDHLLQHLENSADPKPAKKIIQQFDKNSKKFKPSWVWWLEIQQHGRNPFVKSNKDG